MKVRDDEGVASRIVREPCAGYGEASAWRPSSWGCCRASGSRMIMRPCRSMVITAVQP